MSDKDAIMQEAPIVELRGKEVKLERLGAVTIFKIARIMRSLVRKVSKAVGLERDIDISKLDKLPQSELMSLLLTAIEHGEDEVMEVVSMVLGVKEEELRDPEKYGAETVIEVCLALYDDHPDFKCLVASLKKIM